MKKFFSVVMFVVMSASVSAYLIGCESAPPETTQQKVSKQLESKYSLTAEDQQRAETSAKQFFNKEFPAFGGTTKKGMFQECRPTDSNFNGLVTCMGYVPSQKADEMTLITRYCTYRADMVLGCSNEDK